MLKMLVSGRLEEVKVAEPEAIELTWSACTDAWRVGRSGRRGNNTIRERASPPLPLLTSPSPTSNLTHPEFRHLDLLLSLSLSSLCAFCCFIKAFLGLLHRRHDLSLCIPPPPSLSSLSSLRWPLYTRALPAASHPRQLMYLELEGSS